MTLVLALEPRPLDPDSTKLMTEQPLFITRYIQNKHTFSNLYILEMQLENVMTTFDIRHRYSYLGVESARSDKCPV